MFKLKFIALFLIILFAASCGQLKTSFNNLTDNSPEKVKLPKTDLPKNIRHASVNTHFADEKAIIITILPSDEVYVGTDLYPPSAVRETVEKKLKENPSEQQLIYLNSSGDTQFSKIIRILNVIRHSGVENIGLRVAPANEKDKEFYILTVKIQPRPIMDTPPVKPNPLTLILESVRGGYMMLNKEGMEREEIVQKLTQIFKSRDENGLFREGTNEVYKKVTVKVPDFAPYRDVVNLVDAATAAGASPIFLQIDDVDFNSDL
jgi:biopolymer transport protein ExbD